MVLLSDVKFGLSQEETMAAESKKCAHLPLCMAPGVGNYCSQFCKEAGAETEIACDCGRPACEQ